MDHFENVIRLLLQKEGYWVASSFKVNLTKEEKRRTGKPTIPRPEIDLIAYKPSAGEVIAIECKSFLDSSGVDPNSLSATYEVSKDKYKLFTTPRLREIVFDRLAIDLVEQGFLPDPLPIRLGLVAGKVKKGAGNRLAQIMADRGWFYWSPEDIRNRIVALSKSDYENETVYITAKILLRE